MTICPSVVPIPAWEIIPGFLILGSAITFTVLSWYQSIKAKGTLPKGYKQNKDHLAIFR